jgi:N-methylhydantoinase A
VTATAELSFAELKAILDEIREQGRRQLAEEGFTPANTRFETRLDMRFVGQAFELSVPLPKDAHSMADIDRAFLAAYEQRYSYATAGPAEIVTFRLSAYGIVDKPELPRARAEGTPQAAKIGERPVAFDRHFRPTAIYERSLLPVGAEVAGPAIIEETGSTTLVPPGFQAAVDPHGTLVLERR